MSKRWTFMVYLAGDNNLEHFGERDLIEMKSVGSTDVVQVVAQFDRMSDGISRRYFLTHDRSLADDVVAELPETNTGDPAALLDFICWGLQTYPAEQTALILWNHGSGWKDDDIYALARRAGHTEPEAPRSQLRGLRQHRVGRSLFSTSIEAILQYPPPIRAILFDDTSKDFLDNRELKNVLDNVLLSRQGRKLDLIGFDACLMSMIEVADQIQHACHYMVGSQEIEPGDGWPYQHILAVLTTAPDISAENLSRTIVDAYAEHYTKNPAGMPVTQSALRLKYVPALVEAVGYLADGLTASLSDLTFYNLTLLPTLRQVQKFRDRQYIDLGQLGQMLAENSAGGVMSAAPYRVATWLDPASADSVIVAARAVGPDVAFARGLSIYMPLLGSVSPAYASLEFARHCTWKRFLEAFAET